MANRQSAISSSLAFVEISDRWKVNNNTNNNNNNNNNNNDEKGKNNNSLVSCVQLNYRCCHKKVTQWYGRITRKN